MFEELLGKEQIVKNAIPVEKKKNIIYFLVNNDEIVYVGQSTMGTVRVTAHIYDKVFNGYFYKECSENELNDLEAEYIAKFEPIYNCSMPTNNNYKSISQLKQIYNMDARTLKKLFREYNIKPYFHGDYYSVFELNCALKFSIKAGA